MVVITVALKESKELFMTTLYCLALINENLSLAYLNDLRQHVHVDAIILKNGTLCNRCSTYPVDDRALRAVRFHPLMYKIYKGSQCCRTL